MLLKPGEHVMERGPRVGFDQQLMPVHTLNPLQRCGSGTENSDRIGSERIQKFTDFSCCVCRSNRIPISHHDSGECREWRIKHRLAITRFTRIEVLETLRNGKLKGVVVREIALNYNFTGPISAAGASGDLS